MISIKKSMLVASLTISTFSFSAFGDAVNPSIMCRNIAGELALANYMHYKRAKRPLILITKNKFLKEVQYKVLGKIYSINLIFPDMPMKAFKSLVISECVSNDWIGEINSKTETKD